MAPNRKNSFFIDADYKILKAGKALLDFFAEKDSTTPLNHICYEYFFNQQRPCVNCPVEKSKTSMMIENAVLSIEGSNATRPVIITPIPDEQNNVRLLVVDCLGDVFNIDAAPEPVIDAPLPQQADVVYFNRSLTLLAAAGEVEMIGMPNRSIFEVLPGVNAAEHEKVLTAFFDDPANSMLLPVDVPDHPELVYEIHKVHTDAGETFAIALAQNQAEILAKNDQLHRILALSRFASHVSHEVKNPLSILLTNLDMMRVDILEATSLDGVYKLQEYIDNMQQQVEYILKILDTVSALKVHKHDSIVQIDLKMLMNRIVSMAHFKRPHPKNDVMVSFTNDIPKIFMSEMAMERAFSELMVSLWETGGFDAKIKIEVKYVNENDGYFEFDFYTTGKSYYIENLDQLLDDFFLFATNSEENHLGFLISYAAILNHDGQMKFVKTAESGTHVNISLPRIPQVKNQQEGD